MFILVMIFLLSIIYYFRRKKKQRKEISNIMKVCAIQNKDKVFWINLIKIIIYV